MIIKNISINSFGKLKNKSIDFSPNLNIVYGTNESGKSTISAFIEAMLYAYPPRDAGRKKYIPWDETVSSGSMSIEQEGNETTIYRKLTQSSTKNELFPPDFTLPKDFPQDRETFRKCVYSREDGIFDFGRTNEIDMRITNIITTGDENLNVSLAIERLENFKKNLLKKSGPLKETENKITALENELDALTKWEKSTIEQQSELSRLEERLSVLTKQRDALLLAGSKKIDDTLDEEINRQKEYLSHFPENAEVPSPFKFPLWTALLYTLCIILPIIIGFFTSPLISLISLIPLIASIFHFLLKRRAYNKEHSEFLKKVSCISLEEYSRMLTEKRNAEIYYASLIAKKHAAVNKELNEKIRTNELLNTTNEEIAIVSDKIVGLKKSFTTPFLRERKEISSELDHFKQKREELHKKVLFCEKAIEALNYGKNNVSKHLIPRIGTKAMEYINLIAPKNGRNISLEKDLSLLITDPLPQDISSCSFGFKAEIYLCFRIALSEFLYGESAPLILDDPFLGSDDLREKALIDLFAHLAQKRQVIVFTNRKNPHYNQIKCNFIDISPQSDV